jgi:hypothetical protein
MPQLLLPNASSIITNEHERIRDLRAAEVDLNDPPASMSVLQWIRVFDPVIKEERQAGVSRFFVDTDNAAVAAAGEYSTIASASCAVHNELPESARAISCREQVPERFEVESFCVRSGTFAAYWWGYSIYCNHCLCADISFGENGATAIAGVLSAAIGGIPGIVLAAVAGYLAIEAAWLAWADNQCGNIGAFINGTWLSIGTPWVKTAC